MHINGQQSVYRGELISDFVLLAIQQIHSR